MPVFALKGGYMARILLACIGFVGFIGLYAAAREIKKEEKRKVVCAGLLGALFGLIGWLIWG